RGDVPLQGGDRGLGLGVQDGGAFGQDDVGVHGHEADELLAVGTAGVAAGQGSFAQAVLGLRNHAAHAEIDGGDRSISVLANDDVAFFGAQDVHGLGAVGGDAEFIAGLHQQLPDVTAGVGGDVDFVGQFAREADAQDAGEYTIYGAFLETHEGEGFVAEVDVLADFLQDFAGVGAGHGGGRVLVGDRGQVDLQFR